MKKSNKKNTICALIDCIKKYTIDNNIVAVGTIEQIERYKKQLIDNGYEDVFQIKEVEYKNDGHDYFRFNDYKLKEYDGLLYPSCNIEIAEDKKREQLLKLKNISRELSNLKNELSEEELSHLESVLKILERKFNEIKNQKLEIEML